MNIPEIVIKNTSCCADLTRRFRGHLCIMKSPCIETPANGLFLIICAISCTAYSTSSLVIRSCRGNTLPWLDSSDLCRLTYGMEQSWWLD